jgi:N-acetylmuramoyl-L-alanine amidase
MSRKSLIIFSFLFLLIHTAFGGVVSTRYGIYEDKTRIVFNLSQKRDFRVFVLENPRRIVLDIFGEKKVKKLKLPPGVRYRVGFHSWGTRIVIQYAGDFSIKYFRLYNPYRIVLDIYHEENELYRELLRILEEEASGTGSPKPEAVEVKKQDEDPVLKIIAKAKSQPFVYEEKVIVIDPGHGGKDPGAIGYGGIREKHINLAIARKVARYLERDGRFKVILTRKGDRFIPLHKRAEIALRNRADLFISIHSDAAPKGYRKARGTQVFALSYKRAIEKKRQIITSKRYAKLVLGEAADIRSGLVKRVLADLAIDVTLSESVYFARLLAKELKKVAGREVKFKGINRAGFAVLKTPGIPSVLVETGFITNPTEARRLKDPDFQRKIAWSIYRAIVRYFYGKEYTKKLVKF